GMLKGKYGYMSPEQVVGTDVDGRSDLFSVGIILSEMLMGRRLFSAANELDVLLMVRDVRLDRLHKYGAAIPAELIAVLMPALQREPRARFGSAGESREELAEWLFSKRLRVSKADLAALIEGLFPARPTTLAPAGSRVTPTPLTTPDVTPTPVAPVPP